MDTTFNDSGNTSGGSLQLSEQIISYLNETRRWAKFLAIMGFVGVGLIVILALSIGALVNFISSLSPTPLPFPAFLLTVIYLLVALLYFFPVLYLYRFSTKMEFALTRKDQQELTSSFENLKSVFKFLGIMTIVVLTLYALAIIGVVMAVIMMRH